MRESATESEGEEKTGDGEIGKKERKIRQKETRWIERSD